MDNTKNQSDKKQQEILRAAIMHALAIKENFELYAYHIVDQKQFVERVSELNEVHEYSLKIHNKEQ